MAEGMGSSRSPVAVSRAVPKDFLGQLLCVRASGGGTDTSLKRSMDGWPSGHLWAQPGGEGEPFSQLCAWRWECGTVSSNCPVSTQTVFLWTPLKAILSRPIASWASVPSIQTQRPHYTRRAGTHIRISKGPFHSFHLLLWLTPPRSDSPPPLSPLDFTACSPVRSNLSDHPPCAHSRGSLSCPLCPSRSHSPSEAQGPSPESTALTLQGRASPLSSFYNTLCRCHYFTDAADGPKCWLCTGTSRVVPVRELRTEPARRTVPTSFSLSTDLPAPRQAPGPTVTPGLHSE